MASVRNKMIYPATTAMIAGGAGMTLREHFIISIAAALANRSTLLGNTEIVNQSTAIADALIAKIDATA